MDKVDAPENAPGSIRLAFAEAAESGNDVLEADSLYKSFGSREILKGISFMIKKRDHVVIMGPNGCGKSTLIKILGGFENADGGAMEYGTGVVAGYYDQEQRTLDESKTVLEELCDAHEKLTITQIRTALAGFLFFLVGLIGILQTLTDGDEHIYNKNAQQHEAQPFRQQTQRGGTEIQIKIQIEEEKAPKQFVHTAPPPIVLPILYHAPIYCVKQRCAARKIYNCALAFLPKRTIIYSE
jgi:energy-coupling factor transporter ATP-binding protein EcfA2